ncbi:MAG TPA: type II/IV secretion system ATPase subunit [Candidatus Nanoarchaeia archaeon]|nr:type II/IV secretion system ATPase subunit [Candidatus Nanoarchaeia archaeon]
MADENVYEVLHEGEETILRVNAENWLTVPSLEDDPITMSRTLSMLIEVSQATRIVYTQKRDYEYDFPQTRMLVEVALLYNKIVKEKDVISYQQLDIEHGERFLSTKYAKLKNSLFTTMKSDPLGCYVELIRMLREEKTSLEKIQDIKAGPYQQKLIKVLTYILGLFEKTKLVILAKPYLPGYSIGTRDVYKKLFAPVIKPDFMYTKLMASYPIDGEELDSYSIGNSEVTIFKTPDTIQYLYHLSPPEFRLSEEHYELVDLARKIMAEHQPSKEEFTDPERMREVFYNVGRDLLEELANYRNIKISEEELTELTQILVRYTIGFGLIEVLLSDDKIQDVTINSPMGHIPMFIVHADFGDCKTNIVPTPSEAESWASKLRLISARPLDEANPILDTEIEFPGARARVAVIAPPLNPSGLAYAFRRHRDKPWTLGLFIKNGMINSLAAGLMSFIIDGNRTILVAGTRSAGKSALLGAVLTTILRRYRIITIEDTLELPGKALRDLGYNIQQMKVASALSKGSSEVSADEGIRTTLRLGDSALFVGEVRSVEAKALYEAMRVGALANVVAGTIHGDSPYGVYDRVVNDLEVPRTSFKATDIIIVANPIRSPDGLHRWRRVTAIAEIRKHWTEDPLLEHGFADLMKYDAGTDKLVPTDALINGESEILKSIAGNVREWAGDWDAVWSNIEMRGKILQTLVDTSKKTHDSDLLEAEFSILSNDEFHKIAEEVREEVGALDNKMTFFRWNEWLKTMVKKRGKEE